MERGFVITVIVILVGAFILSSFQSKLTGSAFGGTATNTGLSKLPSVEAESVQRCKCPVDVTGKTNKWDNCNGGTSQTVCHQLTCGYYVFNIETKEWDSLSFSCIFQTRCSDPCALLVAQGYNYSPCPYWVDGSTCTNEECHAFRDYEPNRFITKKCKDAQQ